MEGCVKPAPNCCALSSVEMVRVQTQCADPWGYGSNKDESIEKLKNYLLKKKITVAKITLEDTGEGITCYACNCSRGASFHVWVQGTYIHALEGEGFTVK